MEPVLIKLGGALLEEPGTLAPVWAAVRTLMETTRVAVVHGGGPQATDVARRLNHTPRIVHGRRVTTDLDLAIVQWTIRGELNTRLVARASAAGLPAVGLSGVDGGMVRVRRRPPRLIDGEEVDFGWVGDVAGVDTRLPEALLAGGFLPVVAPLGVDEEGLVYNVNADTVARTLAHALHIPRLFLVTESGGVRRHPHDPASLLPACDAARFAEGRQEGWISAGMRTKLEVAFDALEAGIREVYILAPGDLLHPERGTRIVREAAEA